MPTLLGDVGVGVIFGICPSENCSDPFVLDFAICQNGPSFLLRILGLICLMPVLPLFLSLEKALRTILFCF